MTVFGAWMRDLRLAQGKTLKGVARATGLSAMYIGDMERGLRMPTRDLAAVLAWADELGRTHESVVTMWATTRLNLPPGWSVIVVPPGE